MGQNIDSSFAVVPFVGDKDLTSNYQDIYNFTGSGLIYQVFFALSNTQATVNLNLDGVNRSLLSDFNLRDFVESNKYDYNNPQRVYKHPMFSFVSNRDSDMFLLDLSNTPVEFTNSIVLKMKENSGNVKFQAGYIVAQLNES